MTIEPGAIRRLAAMDIQVWRARSPEHAEIAQTPPAAETSAEAGPVKDFSVDAYPGKSRLQTGRIRLEAGSGCWLLVVDDADRARHAKLIEDIRAALGTDDCRFGTWSDSAEAGLAVEDWEAHGIRHALVFGGQVGPGFVQAGELDELKTSGEARRALWRRLQSLLIPTEG